ncbi:MAG: serine/threonine-protein kinase, partial [Planctomycetota bacterium]
MITEPPLIPDIDLLRPIGQGRFGTTYLGRVTRTHSGLQVGALVAVKVLSPEASRDPRARRRFEEEGRLMARVGGPGLVQLLSAGAVRSEEDERLYLVLEYIEGETLREHLQRVGTCSEARVCSIGAQLARALAELHAAGIVHRDVKPENVLVDKSGAIKLADLGLAGSPSEKGLAPGTPPTGLVGSLGYAAPEQYGRGEASSRSDLYSLGVMLFELATGTHPFITAGGSAGDQVGRQLRELAPLPSSREPGLSIFFDRLVGALLERDPALRPASAIEVADILTHRERSAWYQALTDARPRSQQLNRSARERILVSRDTPFIGRDAELAELQSALAECRKGHGHAFVLRGEAGVGKTRLLDRFLAELGKATPPVFVLYSRCLEEDTARPYEPLRRLFEAYFSLGTIPSPQKRAAQWARYVAGLLPGPRPGLQAVADILFGQAAVTAEDSRGEIGEDAVARLLSEALLGIAGEIPLVIVLDNLEWIDRPSLRALDRLVQGMKKSRLLLLAAARDEPIDPEQLVPVDVVVRRGASVLAIPRLDEATIEELLRNRYHSREVARRLLQPVRDGTSGNPDFVLRLLDLFEDEGIVRR